jgi:hypothetical protein
MIITTVSMLDSTTYGVPSGNYDGSSQDFFGNVVQGADYYQGRGVGSIQTVTINVTDFVGQIKILATLNDNPGESAWFETEIFSDGVTPQTGIFPFNILGNFVWMEAEIIDFTAGTINSITVTY